MGTIILPNVHSEHIFDSTQAPVVKLNQFIWDHTSAKNKRSDK